MRNKVNMNISAKIIQTKDYLDVLQKHDWHGAVLLVTSSSFDKKGHTQAIQERVINKAVYVISDTKANPDIADIFKQFNYLKKHNIQHIIALGGGSVMDTAKVLAYALVNAADDFIGVVKSGAVVDQQLDLICIPSTSGTGSEVTPFATVWDCQAEKKYSLYGVRANTVVLDASLSLTLPFDITLYSALDALSHSLEAIWNKNANFVTDALAEKAIELICTSLPIALAQPSLLPARAELQQAALLAGLAISQTKTAIAHAISYPLTLKFGIPHGLACSFTLIPLINSLTQAQIKLSKVLADKVINMLQSLNLPAEIEKFADKDEVLTAVDSELDPSRANNFVVNADKQFVARIVNQSM